MLSVHSKSITMRLDKNGEQVFYSVSMCICVHLRALGHAPSPKKGNNVGEYVVKIEIKWIPWPYDLRVKSTSRHWISRREYLKLFRHMHRNVVLVTGDIFGYSNKPCNIDLQNETLYALAWTEMGAMQKQLQMRTMNEPTSRRFTISATWLPLGHVCTIG